MSVETLTVVTTNGKEIPIVIDYSSAPIFMALGWLVVLLITLYAIYKWKSGKGAEKK